MANIDFVEKNNAAMSVIIRGESEEKMEVYER